MSYNIQPQRKEGDPAGEKWTLSLPFPNLLRSLNRKAGTREHSDPANGDYSPATVQYIQLLYSSTSRRYDSAVTEKLGSASQTFRKGRDTNAGEKPMECEKKAAHGLCPLPPRIPRSTMGAENKGGTARRSALGELGKKTKNEGGKKERKKRQTVQ